MKLSNKQKQIDKLLNELRSNIYTAIENLPDNPKIERTRRSFTMKVSDLSDKKVLSPFYYDFKAQHKIILDHLGVTREPVLFLQKIVETNSVYGEKLNPEVVLQIKDILENNSF